MRTPTTFIATVTRLNAVIDDTSTLPVDKILALCELYWRYQHDVHNQAKTVRKIEDITKKVKNDSCELG